MYHKMTSDTASIRAKVINIKAGNSNFRTVKLLIGHMEFIFVHILWYVKKVDDLEN